jgi:hypothetical protein
MLRKSNSDTYLKLMRMVNTISQEHRNQSGALNVSHMSGPDLCMLVRLTLLEPN